MGWYWNRMDNIWHKPNPLPESVKNRPAKSHEYLFLLTKSAKYYYDHIAVLEEVAHERGRNYIQTGSPKYSNGKYLSIARGTERWPQRIYPNGNNQAVGGFDGIPARNKRSVWTIPIQPTSYAHFATFPEKLVEPCILAGTSERGCCPKCGAPWTRVVDKVSPGEYINKHYTAIDKGEDDADRIRHNITVGRRPSCSCGAGEPVPCIVFDPFAGGGTVELVATRLGRRSVGCELNYAYIRDIANKRMEGVQIKLPETAEGEDNEG